MSEQNEKLSKFLSGLKTEYDRACELKKVRGELMQAAGHSNAAYEYMDDIDRSYTVQMLNLRDRILSDIREYFYGNQS